MCICCPAGAFCSAGAHSTPLQCINASRAAQTAADCVAFPRDIRLYLPGRRYPFGALEYPFISGEPMRPGLLAPAEREQVARGAARFCVQLHSISDEACRPNITRAEEALARLNLAIAQNLLSDAELALLRAHGAQCLDILRSRRPFCLLHGDLWAENLLLDEQKRLCGVLDFANCGYLVTEVDYACMRNLADGFLEQLLRHAQEPVRYGDVLLFALRRKFTSLGQILDGNPQDLPCQVEKLRAALSLLEGRN